MTFGEFFLAVYLGVGIGLTISFRLWVGRPATESWWKYPVLILFWPGLFLWLAHRIEKNK